MSTRKDQEEREIQEWIERGLTDTPADAPSVHQEDLAAYRALFEALKEEPATGLPYGFSAGVITRIRVRKDRLMDFRWNLILPFGLLFILVIIYLAALYIDSEYARTLVRLFLQFKWQIVFGIACFLVVQYLDQQLIKKKYAEQP